MRKNRIRNVLVHAPASLQALTPKIDAFYMEVIERRLNQSDLTAQEKLAVIDRLAHRHTRVLTDEPKFVQKRRKQRYSENVSTFDWYK